MASKTIGTVLTLKDEYSKTLKKTSKKTKEFNRQLKKSGNSFKDFKKKGTDSFKSVAKNVAGLVTAYAGFSAVKNFLTESTEAAKAQIDAETKLQAVLKNTKGITDEQIDSIKKYSSELQNVGVIGDEVALSGVQQLGTYQLQTDTLKQLMPGMEDLLAQQKGLNATQDDAVNIGNMLGKVMTGQTGALSKAGINFSDAQKEVLKFGTEQEKAAALAEVLEQNVGGVNEALAKTDAGKTQQMKNAWGDLKEEVGKVTVKLQGEFAQWFMEKLPSLQEKVEEFKTKFGELRESIKKVISKAKDLYNFISDNWSKIAPIIEGIVGAIAAYNVIMGIMGIVTGGTAGAVGAYNAVMGIMAVATGAAATAQGILNSVMYLCPVLLIAAGIGVLIAAIVLLIKNWDEVKATGEKAWNGIKEAFENFKKNVSEKFNSFIDGIKEKWASFKEFLKHPITGTINLIEKHKTSKSGNSDDTGGNALGTSYWKGGRTAINERGGEIVDLPNGSRVIPADKSAKVLNNSKSNNIVININGVNKSTSEIMSELMPQLKLKLANI